jgi:hypothetical protein
MLVAIASFSWPSLANFVPLFFMKGKRVGIKVFLVHRSELWQKKAKTEAHALHVLCPQIGLIGFLTMPRQKQG